MEGEFECKHVTLYSKKFIMKRSIEAENPPLKVPRSDITTCSPAVRLKLDELYAIGVTCNNLVQDRGVEWDERAPWCSTCIIVAYHFRCTRLPKLSDKSCPHAPLVFVKWFATNISKRLIVIPIPIVELFTWL